MKPVSTRAMLSEGYLRMRTTVGRLRNHAFAVRFLTRTKGVTSARRPTPFIS